MNNTEHKYEDKRLYDFNDPMVKLLEKEGLIVKNGLLERFFADKMRRFEPDDNMKKVMKDIKKKCNPLNYNVPEKLKDIEIYEISDEEYIDLFTKHTELTELAYDLVYICFKKTRSFFYHENETDKKQYMIVCVDNELRLFDADNFMIYRLYYDMADHILLAIRRLLLRRKMFITDKLFFKVNNMLWSEHPFLAQHHLGDLLNKVYLDREWLDRHVYN